MKKPALLLLAAAAAMALLGVLWVSQRDEGRGARGAAPVEAPASPVAAPERTELETAAGVAPKVQESTAEPASEAAEREAVEGDGSGRRIAGRVRFPKGTPDDETLRVVALARNLSPREIYGAGGTLLAERESKEITRGSAPVRADGRFELALGSAEDVWLALDGRFLYSSRATPVPAGTPEAELEAELGGCLAGQVSLPGGASEAEPFAGLVVELGPDSESFSMGAIASAPLFRRHARLDGDGRFELRALPAGHAHELEVDSTEWADQSLHGLAFEPGRVRSVEVRLLVGASLSGRVVDEAGAPVAGAKVLAAESVVWGFAGEELAEVESDASGQFVLTHVAPGKCLLIAKKEGFLESDGEKLELLDGESRVGLQVRLGSGAALAGRVRLEDGTPCAEAKVQVSFDPEALVGMAALNAARGASGRATCASDGRFEVTGLGKGPFLVEASLERPAADGQKETWRAKAKGVKPDTRDLELELRAPLALRGRVRSEAGQPITLFQLRAVADAGAFFIPGEKRTERIEHEQGEFVLRGLEEGKWKVDASAEGFGPMTPLEITLPQPVDQPLELVLAPAATIAGTVLDPGGRAVTGARVTVQTDAALRIQRLRGDLVLPEATTLADGSFLLSGLAAGTSSIFASLDGFAPSEAQSVTSSPEAPASGIVLRLRKGALVTGEVYGKDGKPAGGVQVVAQESGTFDMRSQRAETDGTFRFEALAPGSWSITAILEGAEVDVEGSPSETSASFLENMRFTLVQLEDGEEEHVVLGAPPKDPVLVRGTVRHGKEPVAEGLVSFVAEGSKGLEALKIAPLGADGRYQAELGAPGDYVVSVQITRGGGGFAQNTIEFRERIPETPEHTLDFELPLGGVRGTVLGPDRRPLGGARMSLVTEGGLESGSMLGGHYSEATTDADGSYEFEYLRPGTYSVAAGGALFGGAFGSGSEAGRRIRSGLVVEEGRVLEGIDFELEEPANIRGRVIDAGGTPVKDVALFVRDAGGRLLDRFSMITSAADGTFTYTGVAPGEYVVSARGKGQASEESAPVRVEKGGSASVELVLRPGTKLVVEVVDEEGQALRARVSVVDARGREMQGMLGFAEIASGFGEGLDTKRTVVGPLPPGSYTVTASTSDGKQASRPVNLDGQAERRLKLRLR